MSDVIETAVETKAKSFLVSKTFWANVIVTPAGVWLASHNFVLDAQTQAELVMTGIGFMNLVLRKLTTQPVSLSLPAKSPAAGVTAPVSKTLGIVLAFCLLGGGLSGCAGTTPQDQLNAVEAGYTISTALGNAYIALPTCGTPGVTKVCSQPATVSEIQRLEAVIPTDLAALQVAITANAATSSFFAKLTADVGALAVIVATLPTAGPSAAPAAAPATAS